MVRKSAVMAAADAHGLSKRERVAVAGYAEKHGREYDDVDSLIADALD